MMKLSLGPTFRHFNTRIRVGARRISEHCCCSSISKETSWGGSGIRQGCLLDTGEDISGLSNQKDTLWQTKNTLKRLCLGLEEAAGERKVRASLPGHLYQISGKLIENRWI